jgi:hypothetical protein
VDSKIGANLAQETTILDQLSNKTQTTTTASIYPFMQRAANDAARGRLTVGTKQQLDAKV